MRAVLDTAEAKVRYRAILRNVPEPVPGTVNPKQTFANDVGHLTLWADRELAAVPEKYQQQAFVDIDELIYRAVKRVTIK